MEKVPNSSGDWARFCFDASQQISRYMHALWIIHNSLQKYRINIKSCPDLAFYTC